MGFKKKCYLFYFKLITNSFVTLCFLKLKKKMLLKYCTGLYNEDPMPRQKNE